MSPEPKQEPVPAPKDDQDDPKVVEKKKPLDQTVKEVDHPPAGPPTVVVPPG